MTVANCTISGNLAQGGAGGDGVTSLGFGEGGGIDCSEQIALTFDEYEAVRSHTGSIAVAPAHGYGFRPLAAHARFHHVEPAEAF